MEKNRNIESEMYEYSHIITCEDMQTHKTRNRRIARGHSLGHSDDIWI